MPSFAIIAEGATDQAVLENILTGYFGTDEDEPAVNYVQPPVGGPGGWTLVFRSLREGRHREALQSNDYLVLHLDTDVCDEKGFDVTRHADPEVLIGLVCLRLREALGVEFCEKHAARVLCAIAVDSIECWLLPLLYEGEAAKQSKTAGCLKAANEKLKRQNQPSLSPGESKSVPAYERTSRPYAKRRTLLARGQENPSLAVFLSWLASVPVAPGA